MTLRLIAMWLITFIILGWVNYLVYQNEQLIATGESIFLELAPVDPRSLIQGDYMVLGYKIAREIEATDLPRDGYLVLKLEANQVAQFVRLETEQVPLTDDERRIRYRKRGRGLQLGAESFFFQEGHAKFYAEADYAELRLTESGESILLGLRGPNLEPLGPPQD